MPEPEPLRTCRGWDDIELCVCDLHEGRSTAELQSDGPMPQYTQLDPEMNRSRSWLADAVADSLRTG